MKHGEDGAGLPTNDLWLYKGSFGKIKNRIRAKLKSVFLSHSRLNKPLTLLKKQQKFQRSQPLKYFRNVMQHVKCY